MAAKTFDFLLGFLEMNSTILKMPIKAIVANAGYMKIGIKVLIFLGILLNNSGIISMDPNPNPE